MTDHIARVREQAEKERARRFGRVSVISGARIIPRQTEFVDGAEWLASRLTREKIADAMHRQFLVGEIYLSEFERLTAADAILALLTEEQQR